MKISIALCTYNGENFLSEQLESFLGQTRLPDELIVCDDRSTDETSAIINEYLKKAPFPVKLFVNETNLGSTKNFEKAISLCTGDIIFLSDQDDVWMPEKIELIENEFEKSPEVGLVFTDAELVDEKLNPLGKNLWEYTFRNSKKQRDSREIDFELLCSGEIVTGATMAFRSALKSVCLPVPALKDFIHDGWIAFMCLTFFKIVPLNNLLIKYRQHNNQQIGAYFENPEIDSDKIVSENTHRLQGYTRYRAYQDTVDRLTQPKKEIESFRKVCETALLNSDSSLEIINNPVEYLREKEISLEKKIEHFTTRRDMPFNRISRTPKIISELLKGNYQEFSRGWKSAALDFFEKMNKAKPQSNKE